MNYLRININVPSGTHFIDVEIPDDLPDDEIWQIATEKMIELCGHEVFHKPPDDWKEWNG